MASERRGEVLRAYWLCARATAGLLRRRQLELVTCQVGRQLRFADGTTSRIYRETVRRGAPTADPTLLVVQFRLRVARRSRLLHALFRVESLANTLLFAGFPGFRSKLWLTDERTGIYRGVYQWDGQDAARHYATTLVALLRRICVPGSVAFHIEPGVERDRFLEEPSTVNDDTATRVETWWRLAQEVAA